MQAGKPVQCVKQTDTKLALWLDTMSFEYKEEPKRVEVRL